ncbi:EthD domain-containing protein [Streptomyces sp. NPDC013172]
MWFESWADHDAFFASKNYKELVNPDESTFIDMNSVAVMVTEERSVI